MGGLADSWGIIPLVFMQIIALVIGGYYAFKLPKRESSIKLPSLREMMGEIKEGFSEVRKSKEFLRLKPFILLYFFSLKSILKRFKLFFQEIK